VTDPASWNQVKELFHAALELPLPERDAFLSQACGADSALQAEVESLLVAHADAGSFAQAPIPDLTASALAPSGAETPAAGVGDSVGRWLGSYEVIDRIGAGGMGEVYRGRDTKLGREVAIKILRPAFAADPDRLARFEREARVLASLNHPHIGAIYGVEDADGVHALVLELVDGETLADRLEKGAMPLDQALSIAIQIASALDTAQRAGIVHRDLKPGNIMLTRRGGASAPPMAKLLDFGLAKASAPAVARAERSMQPTSPPPTLTAPGTILGTRQYMAPEQLEGREPDPRTDIFAFGAVLYETLTGKKAFEGKSHASVSAAIMSTDPTPISAVQPLIPPALDRVVAICLAKDPDDRWQRARDVLRELQWIVEAGGQVSGAAPRGTTVRTRGRLAWVMAVVATVAALGMGALQFARPRPQPAAAIRFQVSPPAGSSFIGGAVTFSQALSPDGQRVAFGVNTSGGAALAVRSFDAVDAQLLPGTEGGASPFWSPDSRFIGFFAQGKLKKIDVAGAPPLTVCDANGAFGGTWNRDGIILFAPNQGTSGLFRVSAAGGAPTPVTTLDAAKKERAHLSPWFLPDGRRFLYVAMAPTTVYVGSLDAAERIPLLASDSKAIYADGYLLFIRQGTLLAHSFDSAQLRTKGESFPVAENVINNPILAGGVFSASTTGVLAYRSGGLLDQPNARTQLTWVDRAGKALGSVARPGPYRNPELSPDGARVALNAVDSQSGTQDLWLAELATGVASRLTFDRGNDTYPVWSPNGRRIVFASDREGGVPHLYQKRVDGVGVEEPVVKSSLNMLPYSWSPDGRFLAYRTPVNGRNQIGIVPLVGEQTLHWFDPTGFAQYNGQVSPDGRWLAYASDESGRLEVYVQSFPAPGGGRWQISKDGGLFPRWRRDGRELFYYADDGRLMAVPLRSTTTLDVGDPVPLFEAHMLNGPAISAGLRHQYDVARDGQRFLLNVPLEDAATPSITVVLNWAAGLKN
jgi:Tol biopolymer transport system component